MYQIVEIIQSLSFSEWHEMYSIFIFYLVAYLTHVTLHYVNKKNSTFNNREAIILRSNFSFSFCNPLRFYFEIDNCNEGGLYIFVWMFTKQIIKITSKVCQGQISRFFPAVANIGKLNTSTGLN